MNSIFDKNYLEQLIANQVEENLELEYKAAPALLKEDKKVIEITKDVSAFANSNGGILIYGIKEDQTNRHFPGKIDPVDRKIASKEWLEQILNSRIRPRIHGLKIHIVDFSGDQAVYILQIPKGETAHQADDKRYYRRHNFMVEPLFDHEIRDIMGRQKNANITVEFKIRRQTNPVSSQKEPFLYFLEVYARNIGKIYAKYIHLVLSIPKKCVRGNHYDRSGQGNEEFKIRNTFRDLVAPDAFRYYQGPIAKPTQYGPTRYEPILPGTDLMIKSLPINEYSTDAGNVISWTIYADNAEPRNGMVEFCKIERS